MMDHTKKLIISDKKIRNFNANTHENKMPIFRILHYFKIKILAYAIHYLLLNT